MNPKFNIFSPENETRINNHYDEEDDPNFDPSTIYGDYCEVENLSNGRIPKCNPGECRSSLLQHLQESASPSPHCKQISTYTLIELRTERSNFTQSGFDVLDKYTDQEE
jgi:hypothetical protein